MENDNAEQIHRHRHLPEDIVIEILARLPVISLLRFKNVCKSWRSFISSKTFIKTHLQNSKRNETFAHHWIISKRQEIRAHSLYSLLIEPVTHPFPLDFFSMNSCVDLQIVGCCNGLVCVLVDEYQFFLLNPSTRESKELPDFFNGTNLPKERGLINGCGFGFDEISGDYKISALFFMKIPHRTFVARVYSFKADSWGGNMFFKNGWKFGLLGKFVSGKLHWIKDCVDSKSKLEIDCLDLKSETFEIVERPICWEGCVPSLGVLKGCLCVCLNSPPSNGFEIWIWGEYGVEDSWAKFVTIPYPFQYSWCTPHFIPLFVLANDEVLFTYKSLFFIYNPKDNCVGRWHTDEFGLLDYMSEVEVYTESLVSLVRDVVINDDDGDVRKKRKTKCMTE